ncbi:MAG: endonuclease III [Alphaproteobacteria bacterium]|nr:endonuclease III [Alphaproteobacteria bacterium]USO08552.1 MAG: endonuclease III [Rhodospirillales bacterium]
MRRRHDRRMTILCDRLLKPSEIAALFTTLRAANPEPKGELDYSSPFTLLVAVVLSAQATDKSVNKATPALFALADTPEKMAALDEAQIRDCIKTIGLFRAKAKNIRLLSQKLVSEFGGVVPQTREELVTLPGVGRKSANVVLNIAFGQDTIAVDTHIFRVANRAGLSRGKTPEAVEADLEKRIPAPFRSHAHHWLILHGRYICTARKPNCAACPIASVCRFTAKTL